MEQNALHVSTNESRGRIQGLFSLIRDNDLSNSISFVMAMYTAQAHTDRLIPAPHKNITTLFFCLMAISSVVVVALKRWQTAPFAEQE